MSFLELWYGWKSLPQKDPASGTRGSMAYWHVEFALDYFGQIRGEQSDNTHIRQLWFTVTVIINRRWCSCGNRLNKQLNVWHFRKFSNIKLTVLTSSQLNTSTIQAASLTPKKKDSVTFPAKTFFFFAFFCFYRSQIYSSQWPATQHLFFTNFLASKLQTNISQPTMSLHHHQVRRQRGANDFRDTFLEATESSPHCSWEVPKWWTYGRSMDVGGVEKIVISKQNAGGEKTWLVWKDVFSCFFFCVFFFFFV